MKTNMKANSSKTMSGAARTRLMATLAALALALSACGTATTSDTAADLPTLEAATDDKSNDEKSENAKDDSGPKEEVDPEQAMAQYDSCMKEQGVDMGVFDGAGSGDGSEVQEFIIDEEVDGEFDFEAFEAAQEECESILTDAFGSFEATPEQEAEMADQMLELTKCMNDAGFDIDLSENVFELDESVDFEAFEAAMNECQPGSIAAQAEPTS